MSKTPTAFVSYSWDSEEHKEWVRKFAERLRSDGIETILDQWHAYPGDQLPHFMASSIQDNDFVLIICTPLYKEKSQRPSGGVRYEGDIITSELFILQNQRKYIPVLRSGEWGDASPIWLSGKYHIDLRECVNFEKNYADLILTLRDERPQPPPVRQTNSAEVVGVAQGHQMASEENQDAWQDIKLTGIILEEVTSPRNDGTRGSALYEVPFRLSRRPPYEWEHLFIQSWNHPPSFTSMHRPGIASVIGDKVILDGTTIEEVESYHFATLKLALKEANQKMAGWTQKQQRLHEQEKKRQQEHESKLSDIAKKLRFDDE